MTIISHSSNVYSDNVKGMKCSYKRKNEKQISRDNRRHTSWRENCVTRSKPGKHSSDNNYQAIEEVNANRTPVINSKSQIESVSEGQERSVTRSQTAKLSTEDNQPGIAESTRPVINHDSPIEIVRHDSFKLNAKTPEFFPIELNFTKRDIEDIEYSDLSDCNSMKDEEDFISPSCFFGSSCRGLCDAYTSVNTEKHEIFECLKCKLLYVCAMCVKSGGHVHHQHYLKLYQNS